MSIDLSQIRRYELKYTISEKMAAGIRDYIRGFCSFDKNVPPGENGYIVNNLYFDTADLRFYFDTKFRKLTRYKPRARFYGDKATDYIWPEIKYRHSSVIWKTRYPLRVEKWPELFYPQKSDRVQPIFKNSLNTFDDLIYWYHAEPILHVRYFREPYVTDIEAYGRITFDRQLSYRPANGLIDLPEGSDGMVYYDDPVTTISGESPVLLEIKVETLVPWWVVDLIKRFDLIQRPFSKYCYGIDHHYGCIPCSRRSACGF